MSKPERIGDIPPHVLAGLTSTHGGMMYWTEEKLALEQELAEYEVEKRDGHAPEFQDEAELYRLARLGLAAEAVTARNFDEGMDWGNIGTWDTLEGREVADLVRAFVHHPAWRRE